MADGAEVAGREGCGQVKMGANRIECNVVLPSGVKRAGICWDTETGRIVSVDDTLVSAPEQLLLFPGFIDIHVHAREFPRPSETDGRAMALWEAACRKETFASAGDAAINGGVTLFAAMPNDPVPPADPETYERKRQAAKRSACPAVLFGAITENSEPWEDLPYKVYLDVSPSPTCFSYWNTVESVLQRYRGCRVFFHAEDPEILIDYPNEAPRWKNRPPEAEIRAVRQILSMTAKFALRTHICHVSTEGAVRLIEDYNRHSQQKVTCEVTPHHLFFGVSDGKITCCGGGELSDVTLLDCNPPLRQEGDRRFVIEALREGLIDVLASDHAPHTLDDKRNGAPGMPHLDTLGPFVGVLLKQWNFSPVRVAEILCAAPGRLFSQDLGIPQGELQPGYAASFSLLNLADSTLVDGNLIRGRGVLKTRCGWSPFSGIELPASVETVIIRGRTMAV